MSPSDLSCRTCFFWLPQPDLELQYRPGVAMGQCRCRSPRVMPVRDRVVTRWPLSGEDDWCGEHATRETEETPGGES